MSKPEIVIAPPRKELLRSLNEKEPEPDHWFDTMKAITFCHVAGHDVIGIVDSALKGAEGVGDASGRNPSGDENVCQVRVLGAHETSDSQTLPEPPVESGISGVERVSAPEILEEK